MAPGGTEKLQIEEHHLNYVQYQLSNIDDEQVAVLVKDGSLSPAAQQALRHVLDQKSVVAGLQSQIDSHKREIDSITKDQARVRENMKVLKGSSEEKALLLRYTRQLDQQEDRLNTLQGEIAGLNTRRDQAQGDLDQLIQSIALNETM